MKKLSSLSDLSSLLTDEEKKRLEEERPRAVAGHDGKGRTVRLRIDKNGRKGKTVTLVIDLQHNPDTMEEIARILKQHCGAGGTVRGGEIEIQGDQRVRLSEKLKEMNYKVK